MEPGLAPTRGRSPGESTAPSALAAAGGGVIVGVMATALTFAGGLAFKGSGVQDFLLKMEVISWGIGSLVGGMAALHFGKRRGFTLPIWVSIVLIGVNGVGTLGFPDFRRSWIAGGLVAILAGLLVGWASRRRRTE